MNNKTPVIVLEFILAMIIFSFCIGFSGWLIVSTFNFFKFLIG